MRAVQSLPTEVDENPDLLPLKMLIWGGGDGISKYQSFLSKFKFVS